MNSDFPSTLRQNGSCWEMEFPVSLNPWWLFLSSYYGIIGLLLDLASYQLGFEKAEAGFLCCAG